jgi:Spy/CpxP family protein refolding chaperone
VVVILCFIMAFAAGLLVGRQTSRIASAPPEESSSTTRPSGGRHGWLVQALDLDASQQKQLGEIWSDPARRGGREREERRRELRRERDEAIAALVPPEHYGKYDQILEHYFNQLDAIDREMRASFDTAVEQTKLILTPEQRVKYEALLKRHQSPERDAKSRDRSGERDSDQPPGRQSERDDAPPTGPQ